MTDFKIHQVVEVVRQRWVQVLTMFALALGSLLAVQWSIDSVRVEQLVKIPDLPGQPQVQSELQQLTKKFATTEVFRDTLLNAASSQFRAALGAHLNFKPGDFASIKEEVLVDYAQDFSAHQGEKGDLIRLQATVDDTVFAKRVFDIFIDHVGAAAIEVAEIHKDPFLAENAANQTRQFDFDKWHQILVTEGLLKTNPISEHVIMTMPAWFVTGPGAVVALLGAIAFAYIQGPLSQSRHTARKGGQKRKKNRKRKELYQEAA